MATSAKAVASQVRHMRGDDATAMEKLRKLLSSRRHRAVSVEDARLYFDRTTRRRKAQGAARQKALRARRLVEGACTRCGDPAVGTTCAACNDNSKDAMKASRAQRRAR